MSKKETLKSCICNVHAHGQSQQAHHPQKTTGNVHMLYSFSHICLIFKPMVTAVLKSAGKNAEANIHLLIDQSLIEPL